MEGSDETGVMQRIHSSFGDCSSSLYNQSSNNNQMGIHGQMQNLSVIEGSNNHNYNYNYNNSNCNSNSNSNSNSKRPPSYPHSQFVAPKIVPQQFGGSQSYAMGPTHSRSLSQSSFFTFDHLPPLSPTVCKESVTPISTSNEVAMEEKDTGFQGGTGVHVNEGRPPRRGHRRSSSDVPMGFASMGQSQFMAKEKEREKEEKKPAQLVLKQESDWGWTGNAAGDGGGDIKSEGEVVDDLFSAYMNLDNLDALNSSSLEDKDRDSRASGTRTNESSENEVESGIAGNARAIHGDMSGNSAEKRGKRSAPGEIAQKARHFRSISMDSFMGSLNFSDESPKLPPSPGIRSAQHSPSSSFDGNNSKFNLEFANGDFSPAEVKKIMESDKLAELAMSDPKRVKRILANRQSAARSKERKLRYIAELEHKVQTLQTEATTLSAQLTLLQRDSAGLTSQNNELRFRLQSMEQQAQLREALNEALTAEVQRLKLTAERSGEASQQVMTSNPMMQMQPSQFNMYQQPQQNNQKQQQASQQSQGRQQSQSTQTQQDTKALKS